MRMSTLLATSVVAFVTVQVGAVDVPIEERDAVDFTIPAVGIPANTFIGNGRLSDALAVMFTQTNAPCQISAWVKSGSGPSGWEWQGFVELPGMPAAGVVAEPSARTVISNGVDTLAFTRAPGLACVLRRINGAWEYRGSISYPPSTSSSVLRAIDGDTAVIAPTSSPYQVVQRQRDGTWSVVGSFVPSDLHPFSTTVVSLQGPQYLVTASTVAISTNFPVDVMRVAVAELPPNFEMSLRGVLMSPLPLTWRFGSYMATDGDWTALDCRQLATPESAIAFYHRQPDGTLQLMQLATNAGGVPVYLRDGRMVASDAVWSLDQSGQWRKGELLAPPAAAQTGSAFSARGLISGEDVIRLVPVSSSPPSLEIWKNAFDCDSNGVDDALEIAEDSALDCNLNGRKDSCDIASGVLADANRNGLPDLCESDCDANAVSDLTQLRRGAASSCDQPAVLASCAIAAGAPDVNSDGLVDTCGPDLNHNGTPDLLEVLGNSATDCNGDGNPDDVPSYSTNGNWEPVGGHAIVGLTTIGLMVNQRFVTDPKRRLISGISFFIETESVYFSGYGFCTAVNRPISVVLARDPNGDGLANDAEVVGYATGIATDDHWQTLLFDPVEIDTPMFFASFTVGGSLESPCFDITTDSSCTASTGSTPENCARISYGAFSGSLPANPQATLRADNVQLYSNVVVPMEVHSVQCSHPADFNHDGVVDGADLGTLLGQWGPAGGSPCDINRDNSVDGADLGLLLGSWGPV